MIRLLPSLALILVSTSIHAAGVNGRDHGVSVPSHVTRTAIPVCYDFGCKTRDTVSLSMPEWREVAGWFEPAANTPAAEREQLKKAIGWMEVLVGRHTPTSVDLEFDKVNDIDKRETGHMDCIDESVNTTTYLRLFESNGFLKHHVVIEEAYRRSLFDQHWAGQVRETATGTRYIFDSWFQPNGYLPVVQKSTDWEDITMLSAVVDNSPDPEDKKIKRSFWHRLLRGE